MRDIQRCSGETKPTRLAVETEALSQTNVVSGNASVTMPDTAVSADMLIGDTTGNRTDIGLVKSKSGDSLPP